MMQIMDFVALTLAASALVDVWFNGSLFAEWRSFLEAKQDPAGPMEEGSEPLTDVVITEPGRLMRWADRVIPFWMVELLNCRYCFSHHAPIWLALLFFGPALFLEEPWASLLKLPVYCLAATRAGNVLNAWLPDDAKYER